MIRFVHKGDFHKTEEFLRKAASGNFYGRLPELAQKGVEALASASPKDSGLTASKWTYQIERNGSSARISWINENVNNGVNIAIILQYGHGTGTGGYVEGRDYINPAIQPVFDEIAEGVWKEGTAG